VNRGPWVAFWALCAGALVAMVAAHEAAGDSAAAVFAVWGLMVVAMMAPTAAPMLRVFADVQATRGTGGSATFWLFLGGYAVVWLAVSLAFATMQVALSDMGLSTHRGASPGLVAVLLAIAGAYQFSPLKNACARRCRSPLTFLLTRWREGYRGAFRLGARHGIDCVGCCWALMLLALAGGAVSMWWMAGVMVLAGLEKLPRIGDRVTAPVGGALLTAAVVTLAIGVT
jgi:predicted metal-binding membrane protein